MLISEKHIINKSHPFYKEIDRICFESKNLYNRGLYVVRQVFINTSKLKEEGLTEYATYINYYDTNKFCIGTKDFDYYNLPPKVSNQTLMLLDKNFKSFFALCKMYRENKDSLNGQPKLPKYLHKTKGRYVATFDIQTISKKELKKGIIKLSGSDIAIPVVNKRNGSLRQVRLVPMSNKKYKIEVIYEVEEKDMGLDKGNIISIDYGVNNLVTITSNVEGFVPRLIKGGYIKSINQYYNKNKSKYQSELPNHPTLKDVNGKARQLHNSKKIYDLTHKRNCKIEHEFHQYSNKIISLCIEYNIGTIVIGKNKDWKDNVDMSKKVNQNFVSIPYNKLTQQLKYKSGLICNEVVEQEESYTSKASFIDNDFIPVYTKNDNTKHHFSGSRKLRGLYISKEGIKINADVNGSYNILRKYLLSLDRELNSKGCIITPIKM